MLADTLHRTAIHGADGNAATGLAEHVVRIGNTLGTHRCYVLMQRSDHRDDHEGELYPLLEHQGKAQHVVDLEPLPPEFWPSLLELQLDRGIDSAINAILAAMAIADHEVEALLEGRTHRVAGWIFTTLSAGSMARRIREFALRYRARDKRKKWVRFYDPLVADLHWHVLKNSQREALLQDIRGWAWLDRWGSLSVAALNGGKTVQGTVYSESQWQQCQAIEPVNQAWIRARSADCVPEPRQLLDVLDTTVAGLTNGIQARADIELFAWHALTLGADFHHREPYRRALQEGLTAGQRYCRIARRWVASTSHAPHTSIAGAT